MRVTIYKLVTQEVYDIHNVKVLFLLSNLRIEDDMKKHVAEFFGKFTLFSFKDCVAQFIYFLNGLRS